MAIRTTRTAKMPTVAVDRDALFARLGRSYTQEEFEKLCFEFGIELDDVEEEASEQDGEEAGKPRVVYKIEVAANRYDLLCIEGIARALRIFLGLDANPAYKTVSPASGKPIELTIEPETADVRPYCVAAVLRDVTFTEESYKSFIDLQDKLHQNLCRHRRLVAIGTHDLSTLRPPFRYRALPPREIRFQPLSQSKEWVADELLDFYETDPSVKHLKQYPAIIKDSPVYPVIVDADNVVLSLPPIINGEHSKISTATKDVFIECTAVDLPKAHVVLNTVVTMFSEYCAAPFTVEPVRVLQPDGAASLTPDLSTFEMRARLSVLNATASINIDAATAATLASKMGLDARVLAAKDTATASSSSSSSSSSGGDEGASEESIVCSVPPTRSDILHECDVIEDVAIAYGFNNIVPRIPSTPTCAATLPVSHLTDRVRESLVAMGFWECLTAVLISRAECFDFARLPDDGSAVTVANPKSESFQVARKSLLPGLLKSVASNKALSHTAGLRFFEVSDVVLLDETSDTGARNERRAAACYCGPTAGFEVVQGVLERLMQQLEVPRRWSSPAAAVAAGAVSASASAEEVHAAMTAWGRNGLAFRVDEHAHPSFFPGRCGRIVLLRQVEDSSSSDTASVEEREVGLFGIIHPEVLKAFEVTLPCSIVEFALDAFV